jgi:phosphoglycolate phosphatase-like HAD superfamily hydrolase
MLRKLKAAGRVLTIASSNRLVNIKKSLGELFLLFDCISAYDTDTSKSAGLKRILACTSPPQVLVGDTEKDYQAARDAGTNFIGASYGWQISSDDKRFSVAHSVQELESLLLS